MLVVVEYAVLAALWGTTLLLIPSVLRGSRRLLFGFMLAFAFTMSLVADGPYAFVDRLLGGVDITYFIFHATAIICVALFGCLIQTAVSKVGLTRARKLISFWGATALIALQAALFFGSGWEVADIEFVGAGDWGEVLYSFTTWVALLVLAISTIIACGTDFIRQTDTVIKTALVIIALGCATVVVYVAIQFEVGITRAATGDLYVSRPIGLLSDSTMLAAPVLLSVGVGLRLLVGVARNLRDAGRSKRMLWKLTPLWERLLADLPELSIEAPASWVDLYFRGNHASHLHRRYVEVRDSLLLHPGQPLSDREARLIHRIEAHIQHESATPAGTTNDSRINEHQDA